MDTIMEPQMHIRNLLFKAKSAKMVEWNEGLNFSEFIHAVWRLFLNHENFKTTAEHILKSMSEEDIIELLAREVNSEKNN